MSDVKTKKLVTVYEWSKPEDKTPGPDEIIVDGMEEMLGDDLCASDYDPTKEQWPGVPKVNLPPDWRFDS